MKIIKPEVFKNTQDAFDLHGELNYPTFMKYMFLRPIREVDHYKGKITQCVPIIDEAFYERIKGKFYNNITKINWPGVVHILSKDLKEYE